MSDLGNIPAFLRRTQQPEGKEPLTAKKTRTAKRDCVEVKFSGVIRLPINAGDVSTITAANAELDAKIEAAKKALGSSADFKAGDVTFGEMDAAS